MEISELDAYEYIWHTPVKLTQKTSTTVIKVSDHSGKTVYIVPYGMGCECEEGHHCRIMEEADFLTKYSLTEY